MRSFLLQPYPFSDNVGRKLLVCGGTALFVALFLGIFEPFGFDELPTDVKWKHAFLFGTVTFLISSFFQVFLPILIPGLFREESWRSWKEIVYLLITTLFIGAGNYGLILYLYPQSTDVSGLLKAELITLQIGIFPILFVVFMKQIQLYKKFAGEAKEVSKDISVSEQKVIELTAKDSERIVIRGDNQKEELSVFPDDLYFISSSDNYVKVLFKEGQAQKTVLIRSTLKKMEDQLSGHHDFFRSHRMYIVNLHLVTNVSGNAQGLKLHLTGCEETVPVSRSLTETIKERLHQLSRSPQSA